MTVTDVLAIIGAITGVTGTLLGLTALVWDFYKWRYSERVRLKVWASPGFASTTNPQAKLLHFNVTNVGKVATTIKLLSLHGFDSEKEMKNKNGKEPSVVLNFAYSTAPLPYRLEPGNDWSGGIDQTQQGIQDYLKFKYFVVQVEDTLSDKPFRAEIDQTRLLEK